MVPSHLHLNHVKERLIGGVLRLCALSKKRGNSKSGRIIPEGMTKVQAEKAVANSWQAAKRELGVKGKSNYACTIDGDRGHYVQDCCDRGLSDREIIIRRGHIDPELDFCRVKSKYK